MCVREGEEENNTERYIKNGYLWKSEENVSFTHMYSKI